MPLALAIAGSAGVGLLGSVGSALIGSNASKSAANEQLQAAELAANVQQNEFGYTQKQLGPFVSYGQGAEQQLYDKLPQLTAPFKDTQAQLAATPGYQFTLDQGLQATQNQYASEGLSKSGASLKGATNYAEGLASTTYQQQFQNYLSQNLQAYNMLSGQAQLGENAAATTGQQGLTAAANEGNLITSGAAAGAAGTVGSANSIIGGVNNGTSALTNALGLSAITGAYGSGTPFTTESQFGAGGPTNPVV